MWESGKNETLASYRLAHRPGVGQVHRCDAGCFHVSCAGVTLDFPDEATFRRFGERLEAHRRGLSDIELRYGAALLRFTPDEFDRLVLLVQEGVACWLLLDEGCGRPAA